VTTSASIGRGALNHVPEWLRRRTWLVAVPALLAVIYLIAMVVDFHSIISGINLDGDVVVAPVMAKLLGQAPAGSQVILGNHPYYEEFLFMRATAGLPFYRGLWEVAPMLWSVLGFGVLAWTVRRVFGTLEAVLVATALLCFSTLGRFSFFSMDWHSATVVHTILVGAALTWLAPRAADIGWGLLTGLAVILGLINALPVASDVLFGVWALGPAVIAAGVMAWRGKGRIRLTLPAFAVLSAVVAIVAGLVLKHVLRADGIIASPFPLTFAPVASLVNNAELLAEGWMGLGGGAFFGLQIHVLGVVTLVTGGLVLAAFGSALSRTRAMLRTATAAQAARQPLGAPEGAVLAYVAFWAASLVLQGLAFIGSSAPVDILSSRYVLAGYVAIAALLPLAALHGPKWRATVTAAVCVFAISQIYQLVRQPFAPGNTFPTQAQAAQLERFATANGVRYGYAGYWDAADVTWLTHFRLQVFPVQTGPCAPVGVCPSPNVQISSWYAPRPGIHSLLVADPTQPGLTTLVSGLGKPLATTRIGKLTAAIYPFDIASKL
jgi:hypothetical protein